MPVDAFDETIFSGDKTQDADSGKNTYNTSSNDDIMF